MSSLPTPPLSEPPLAHRADWTYTDHLVLTRAARAVLLLRDGDSWILPALHPTEHDFRAVAQIERAVLGQLGLRARVLRCLAIDRSKESSQTMAATFALETEESDPRPGIDARWATRAELARLPFTVPAQRALIDAWLATGGATPTATDHPWVLPGWRGEVDRWLDAQLGARGLGPIVACEQVRTWALSCVLRVRTARGSYYLKALPPAYGPEVAITALLATHFPTVVPPVIAADRERGWLLLADSGPLMDDARLALWDAAVSQIAAMQRAAIPLVGDLLARGCQDQRLDALAAQAATLPGDPLVRAVLTDPEYAALGALVPRLIDRCAELATFGLPATLVHGDLHSGNIAQRGDRLTFFDWGDACVAHPFFVLFALLDARYFPAGATDVGARLRARYLAGWEGYGSPAALRAALSLADSLAALRYTLGCLRCFPNLDPLWTGELTRSLRSSLLTLLASA